ncbi:DUF4190 domain-containing protein [uncultured Cellulomonas sp.]|uniref:DUF4190 domain-containing protein n=1 Tax=uncultured Cellulomonas sp. TaxID=189682 RepID=UPI002617AC41|nr:DUF4190 domain-containing protein [uncultured Cellulomonas sp.]
MGIVSVLVCSIPVVDIVSIVGGIVALVLGIVALRTLAPGVTGKGMAVTGIVLGVVSVVVAVIVSVVLVMAIGDAVRSGELDHSSPSTPTASWTSPTPPSSPARTGGGWTRPPPAARVGRARARTDDRRSPMSHTDPQHPSSDDSSATPSGSSPYGSTYGSSAYGSSQDASPGYGQQGGGWPVDPAPARPSGLAVAALVVGIVSLLVCWVPVVNAVSIVGGIVAVVLGILALRKLTAGRPGKGFAVTGIVLGAVSALVAIAIWVVLAFAVAGLEEGDLDSGVVDDASAAQHAVVAPR